MADIKISCARKRPSVGAARRARNRAGIEMAARLEALAHEDRNDER
jgi:hypothetical protein